MRIDYEIFTLPSTLRIPMQHMSDLFDEGWVAGRGDCMFESILQAASRIEKCHPDLVMMCKMPRLEAIAWLRTRASDLLLRDRERFQPFHANDEGLSFDQFCRDLRRPEGAWGTQLVLAAISEHFRLAIYVFLNDRRGVAKLHVDGLNSTAPVIFLRCSGNVAAQHYTPLHLRRAGASLRRICKTYGL